MLEEIRIWQTRPLEDQYAVVWIDAIHYKIRQEGKVISKAAMIVLGIDMEGVQDILFLCSDNLTGLQKSVEAIFPNSIHQICIVHQIRNCLKFVSYKDRRKIIKAIKLIYKADNEPVARVAFENFKKEWGEKYPLAVKSWDTNWEALTAFLQYPAEI